MSSVSTNMKGITDTEEDVEVCLNIEFYTNFLVTLMCEKGFHITFGVGRGATSTLSRGLVHRRTAFDPFGQLYSFTFLFQSILTIFFLSQLTAAVVTYLAILLQTSLGSNKQSWDPSQQNLTNSTG